MTPATFTAGTVAELIADITAANTNPDPSNTIQLTSSSYVFNQADNPFDGGTATPVITDNGATVKTLTIDGSGVGTASFIRPPGRRRSASSAPKAKSIRAPRRPPSGRP